MLREPVVCVLNTRTLVEQAIATLGVGTLTVMVTVMATVKLV